MGVLDDAVAELQGAPARRRSVLEEAVAELADDLDTRGALPGRRSLLETAGTALKAGAQAGLETAGHGAREIVEGLGETLFSNAPHPEDVGRGYGIEVASGLARKARGLGRAVKGALALPMSPFVAAGTTAETAMRELAPETMILPGGEGGLAPLVRAMAGTPSFDPSLTPEERAATRASMGLGEATNLGVTLAAPFAVGPVVRGARRALPGRRPGPGEPLLPTEEVVAPASTEAVAPVAERPRPADVEALLQRVEEFRPSIETQAAGNRQTLSDAQSLMSGTQPRELDLGTVGARLRRQRADIEPLRTPIEDVIAPETRSRLEQIRQALEEQGGVPTGGTPAAPSLNPFGEEGFFRIPGRPPKPAPPIAGTPLADLEAMQPATPGRGPLERFRQSKDRKSVV